MRSGVTLTGAETHQARPNALPLHGAYSPSACEHILYKDTRAHSNLWKHGVSSDRGEKRNRRLETAQRHKERADKDEVPKR